MKNLCVLFTLFLAIGTLAAQDDPGKKGQEATAKKDSQEAFPKLPAGPPTYKVAMSVYELQEGKRINQRDYSLLVVADDRSGNKLKIGTKTPLSVDSDKITYADVGFEMECSLAEFSNNKVLLRLDLNVSSFAIPEQNADPRSAGLRPVLRGVTQRVRATLTPGKPHIVTSVDDVNSNKRMQVEITATKVE
jgi:hypothetical protein